MHYLGSNPPFSFEEFLNSFERDSEVEVVASHKFCKIHRHNIPFVIDDGTSAGALHGRNAVSDPFPIGCLCDPPACHLNADTLFRVGEHESCIVANHIKLLVDFYFLLRSLSIEILLVSLSGELEDECPLGCLLALELQESEVCILLFQRGHPLL